MLNFLNRHSFRIQDALYKQKLPGAIKSTDSIGNKKYKNTKALQNQIQENEDLLDAWEIAQVRSIPTIRLGEFSATGFQADGVQAGMAGDERRRGGGGGEGGGGGGRGGGEMRLGLLTKLEGRQLFFKPMLPVQERRWVVWEGGKMPAWLGLLS